MIHVRRFDDAVESEHEFAELVWGHAGRRAFYCRTQFHRRVDEAGVAGFARAAATFRQFVRDSTPWPAASRSQDRCAEDEMREHDRPVEEQLKAAISKIDDLREEMDRKFAAIEKRQDEHTALMKSTLVYARKHVELAERSRGRRAS
jgi:hypothetical protein